MNLDVEEDEAPPMLVAADGADDVDVNDGNSQEEEAVVKVPITIVTGTNFACAYDLQLSAS